MLLLVLIICLLATVTLQCAPHAPSRPWTNTTHVSNHHHHSYESYYLDNRTIYNKLIQIEKRIENIERKENILPPAPPAPPAPKQPENPSEVVVKPKEPKEQPEGQENPESDCLVCSPNQPAVDATCENCLPASVSAPYSNYMCTVVNLKCDDGARKLRISDSYETFIIENDFKIRCLKGNWVLTVNNSDKKVDEISCLSK